LAFPLYRLAQYNAHHVDFDANFHLIAATAHGDS
jgi:hypothetical protein